MTRYFKCTKQYEKFYYGAIEEPDNPDYTFIVEIGEMVRLNGIFQTNVNSYDSARTYDPYEVPEYGVLITPFLQKSTLRESHWIESSDLLMYFQEIYPAEEVIKDITLNKLDVNEIKIIGLEDKKLYKLIDENYGEPHFNYEVELTKEQYEYIKNLKEENNGK